MAKLSSFFIILVLCGCFLTISCDAPKNQPSNSAPTANDDGSRISDYTPIPIATPLSTVSDASLCSEIDENDQSEPFSFRSLSNDFNNKETDVVVLATVLTMRPDSLEKGYRPYTYTAKVREVFKGKLRSGDIIEYAYTLEVYGEEPDIKDFLGDRVLWLHKYVNNGKIVYGQNEFMIGSVDCNIIEKLRKISRRK